MLEEGDVDVGRDNDLHLVDDAVDQPPPPDAHGLPPTKARNMRNSVAMRLMIRWECQVAQHVGRARWREALAGGLADIILDVNGAATEEKNN